MAEQLILDPAAAAQVFGRAEAARPEAAHGEPFVTQHNVAVQFGGTTLGLEELPDGSFRVTGNTVPRQCEAATCDANTCGLGQLAMGVDGRRQLNCAAANTTLAFDGLPGYVLTPLSNNVVSLHEPDVSRPVVVNDEQGTPTTLFDKVRTGSVLIVSEHDLAGQPDGAFFALNLADSVIATETTEVNGTRYAAIVFSSRESLGDRDGDAQLGRKTVEAILDREGLTGPAREQAIASLTVQIDVGYSASLQNFAHEVRVPDITLPEGMTAADALAIMDGEAAGNVPPKDRDQRLGGPTRYGLSLARKNNLVDAETGALSRALTASEVMDDQYPGALDHGEIYGHLEAEMGIDAPRTREGCPGNGQICHVHYPKITQRTRVGELVNMGIAPENITYDNSRAVDTASPDNRYASNRRMQLAGIPVGRTLRTVNGVRISFPPRAEAA
ncbi:MAG TPA: hypothetical protein VLF71_06140 [Candidatus Saccharimonadales bacterium]|nr:hypothetical protein [Candidatus Saccharimonadales bacterium]